MSVKLDSKADGSVDFVDDLGDVWLSLTADGDVTKGNSRYKLVDASQLKSINYMTYTAPVDENTVVLEPVSGGTVPFKHGDRVTFHASVANTDAVTINGYPAETPTGVALPASFFRTDVSTEIEFDEINSKFIVYRRIESYKSGSWTITKHENGVMTQNLYDEGFAGFIIDSEYGSLYQGVRIISFTENYVARPVASASVTYGTGASWGSVTVTTVSTVAIRALDDFIRDGTADSKVIISSQGVWY